MKKHIFYLGAMMLSLALTACNNGDTAPADTTIDVVDIKLDGEALSGADNTIVVGQTIELSVTVYPTDATNLGVVWESSDTAVADVSATGVVTGITEGEVTITATTEDGLFESSCEITVEGMKLISENSVEMPSLSIEIDEELTATTNIQNILTDAVAVWESSNTAIATVTNGVIKGIAEGMAYVTVKIGNNEAKALVSVVPAVTIQRCEVPAEGWFESLGAISFKTDNVWTVGTQEWSDVVMAENARTGPWGVDINGDEQLFNGWHEWCEDPSHTEKDHPTYMCDARTNITREYGDLFSWCAVAMYRKQICPDGWRVPSSDDFKALNIALGGQDVGPGLDYVDSNGTIDRYMNDWGAKAGSVCNNYIYISPEGAVAGYWAVNEYDDMEAYIIEINPSVNKVGPEYFWRKNYGMEVRCVRDIE